MDSFAASERFAHLTREERDRLDASSRCEEHGDGDVVWSSSHEGMMLWLVVRGDVTLSLPGAASLDIAALHAGDVFGDLQGAAEMPAGLLHVARGACGVRGVSYAALSRESGEAPGDPDLLAKLGFVCGRAISEKLRMADEVAVRLATAARARGIPLPSRSGSRGNPHLGDDEAAWLEALGHKQEFSEGRAIVSEGEASRGFFVIDRGEVEVRKRAGAGAEEQVLAVLGRRDLFGQMAFFDGRPRSASVVAVDGTVACTHVEVAALELALRVDAAAALRFLGTMRLVLGRMFGDTVCWIESLRSALETAPPGHAEP